MLLAACGVVVAGAAGAADLPRSGDAVAGFEALERVVVDHMREIGAAAATVAVTRARRLVFARGYGYADRSRTRPVAPEALMRVASVSKPLTAAAARLLIAEGRLREDASVYQLLDLGVEAVSDARWKRITVRHLIDHRGGWDRANGFDPVFHVDEIARALRLAQPARPDDLVRYMLRRPLQFDPGARTAYSNFGYVVLGRVIEAASGTSYINFLRQRVLGPHGIGDVLLGRTRIGTRYAEEVEYPVGASTFVTETADAAGGLVASAPALARFMTHYWLDGRARRGGEGSYTFFGSLPGTTAVVRQLPSGIDYAVLMNARRESAFRADLERLAKGLDAALSR